MEDRILIDVKHKEIEFMVKETPNCQYNPYTVGFSRKGGDWMGYYGGLTPKGKEDIEIIEEALQSFIRMDYTQNEISIVRGFVNEIKAPQLQLF